MPNSRLLHGIGIVINHRERVAPNETCVQRHTLLEKGRYEDTVGWPSPLCAEVAGSRHVHTYTSRLE